MGYPAKNQLCSFQIVGFCGTVMFGLASQEIQSTWEISEIGFKFDLNTQSSQFFCKRAYWICTKIQGVSYPPYKTKTNKNFLWAICPNMNKNKITVLLRIGKMLLLFKVEFDRYRYTDTDTDISISVREYSNRYRYPPNLPYRYRYIGMIPIPGSYRYSYRYYIKKSV